MADIKPTSLRSLAGPQKASAELRIRPQTPVRDQLPVDIAPLPSSPAQDLASSEALIADFIQPSPRTMAWLGDVRLAATLESASEALAPGGIAEDAADRYAASVLETHLVARRQLAKLTNALLKT